MEPTSSTVTNESAAPSAAQQPPSPPPLLDLDVNPLSGQVAYAVLDLNGTFISGTSKMKSNAAILFAMLQETGQLKDVFGGQNSNNHLHRLTVTLATTRYILARDETHVYISEQRIQ